MRASATAAGYFGATFCAASLIPRGDCCFAAAACRQGAKGCQRARVQTGATGAERGDVRRSRRGVRNSRLTICTSKPILAVYTLGKRDLRYWRHQRHNRRRPDRTHIHMRDPRGNVRMDRLNSTKQWVSWGVGGFFWPFLCPKTIF